MEKLKFMQLDYELRRSKYDSDVKSKGFLLRGKEIIRDTYAGAKYGFDSISETYDYEPLEKQKIRCW